MKSFDPASPLSYRFPLLYPPPPPQPPPPSPPPISLLNAGNSVGNLAYKHYFGYHGYPCELTQPKDLYQEEYYQVPEFDDSVIGNLLGDASENSYLRQDNWYNEDRVLNFADYRSERLHDAQFPMDYHGCPNHVVSGLKFCQPYDQTGSEDYYGRIFQAWATSAADLGESPVDLDNDSTEGKCIGNGYDFEDDDDDVLSSGHNAPGKLFEDFPDCADTLAQGFFHSERQKLLVQNTSLTAETEENCESLKAELHQAISSLSASFSRLEIQVEHLANQVHDMTVRLSEERLNAPISDHSGDSKSVYEGSEIISMAAEATESEDFSETEDSSQKLEESWYDEDSYNSASDWEII